jgi:predicted dehydrogenase
VNPLPGQRVSPSGTSVNDTIRIGIVGAGAIAQVAHLPVLSKMRGVHMVAICDNDRAKARALAERFGIEHTVTDIEDLLEIEEVDAVVLATPNHLHEPHALSALAAGRHVLCERPLALTSRGVERVLAAAERAGRMVIANNNLRYRTDVQGLSRFIRGGELGRVGGIRAGAYQFKRLAEGWRFRRAESGGGAFFEFGLPLLDLALWVADFPEAVKVTAAMERLSGAGLTSVEDAMLVQIEFANGLTCLIDVHSGYVGQEERWWFEVVATRGSARLAPLRVVKELNGRPTDVSPSGASGRENAFVQSYRSALAHFIAVLRGDVEYEPPTDQITVLKLVEAVYAVAEKGRSGIQ